MSHRLRHILIAAACVSGVFSASVVFAAGNASRENAGTSASKAAIIEQYSGELTRLEQRLFVDAGDGALDEFSLLAASLIASGENRIENLDRYEKSLARWIQELRPSIDFGQPMEKNAEKVFSFMHRRMLAGGYRLESTDLRAVFDKGQYNCISASVLYCCLADGIGLPCRGLETPGHAMCRVFLPNGRLDVETTCPRWFELMHDPAQQAEIRENTLGTTRKRAPASFREVTPIQMAAMIYYNRGVDFLAEKRFAAAAAVNAKALRLDPRNDTARGNFLATLNNWAIDRCSAGCFTEALGLLHDGMTCDPTYPAFGQNFVFLYHAWSESLCGEGRFSEAADLVRKACEEMPEKEYLKQSLDQVFRRWNASTQASSEKGNTIAE
jgi:tetratricopeptide (TPR) repeat protein